MRPVTVSMVVALATVVGAAAAAQDGMLLRSGFLPAGDGGVADPAPAMPAPDGGDLYAPPDIAAGRLTLVPTFTTEDGSNYTAFTARLRAGHAAVPALTSFVEATMSRRRYDSLVADDGLARTNTGHAWRAGVAFDRSASVSGEVAVGYADEFFDGWALTAVNTLTVDGMLVWAPTELATVTFEGATSLGPSGDPASFGSMIYDGSVDIAYAWRRDVTVSGTAGFRHEAHEGAGPLDTNYRTGFSATWRMNATHRFTAGYEHEWQDSTDPSREYQSDAVRLELRMQR